MTYLEKFLEERPYLTTDQVFRGFCPIERYGATRPTDCYIRSNGSDIHISCAACWNREMPETENTKKESNTMETTTTKKTKAQLIEEIEAKNGEIYELKQELEKFEKYRKYDEMADEMFAVKSSLINAGFNENEAFTLMIEMIKTAGKTR